MATYSYGYSGSMLTMAQMEAKSTVAKLNPEFWRRYKALIEYAAKCGVELGVGTGWRVQPNPPPPGFAKPGNSNHEGFPADGSSGGAVAIDTVPAAVVAVDGDAPEVLRAAQLPSDRSGRRAVAHSAS